VTANNKVYNGTTAATLNTGSAALVGVLSGDSVSTSGGSGVFDTSAVGTAKTHTFDRRPLEPIAATVIPPGHYYVQGTSADSFDSRYRASGLVRAEQVLGTVVPLF